MMGVRIDFLEYIDRSNSAKTVEEIFLHFEEALAKLGFDLVLFSLMTDHDSIAKSAGHGIMRNYSEDWMKHYLEKNYADVDPVRKQVMQTTQPFLWDKLNHSLADKPKKMMHEAQDAGLKRGVGLGIHGANREVAGFGFASSDGTAEIDKNILSLIKAITCQFHTAFVDHERKYSIHKTKKPVELTPIEKDIMYYMSLGKSNSVISEIMNMNEHNVHRYVKKLLNKFETDNRTLAVVKAIKYNLINI